jgi:hypothetical protein
MTKSIQSQVAVALALATITATSVRAEGWQDNAIAPVTNPIFFETPMIQSEVRPLFIYHQLDSGFLGQAIDVKVYAVQLRYALTDRLALIATKDGYVDIGKKGKALNADGWADLAAGLKYALFQSEDKQFIVTPGFTIEVPTGNRDVFQGNGSGELNLFVSAMKGWDNLHLTGTVGGRIPFDGDKENSNIRYSGMLDYFVSKWFIPYVSVNAFTTMGNAEALPFQSEGFDLINFGSNDVSGRTQGAIGGGFRTRILQDLDFGFGYEWGVIGRNDIFKNRYTFDLIWRF